MADPIPGTTPVTDQRSQPRGVLPRHAQAWLMAALALGILGIILFTGHPEPMRRAATATTAAVMPDADRLRQYQERLRMLDAQAREQPAAPAPARTPSPRPQAAPRTPDPLAAEKKRRDYESLFAGIVVKPGATASRHDRATADAAALPAAPAMPSVDAIVDAVLRASGQHPSRASGPSRSDASQAPADAAAPSAAPATMRTPSTRTARAHRLAEGTLIPAVLTNRLDGSSEAPVDCLVTTPVYARDGQHVLIPAGARVLGRTKPVQTFGESRLAVAFHRLVMPDGASYALDQFVGLNAIGDAGLRDRVNQHYLSTFGAAGAVGLLTGLSQALGTAGLGHGSGDRTVIVAGGMNEATQTTGRVLERFLNRAPTVTIREGHRIHVYLTGDLALPAYERTSTVATNTGAP